VPGSTGLRKLDIGFVHKRCLEEADYDWSQIIVPRELKSNQAEDTHQGTWLDLARYVREVFHAQGGRRFVQAFTLCDRSCDAIVGVRQGWRHCFLPFQYQQRWSLICLGGIRVSLDRRQSAWIRPHHHMSRQQKLPYHDHTRGQARAISD